MTEPGLPRRGVLAAALGGLGTAGTASARTSDALTDLPRIPLWPGEAPGGEAVVVRPTVVERSPDPAAYRDRAVSGVRAPSLRVYRPTRPGGGAVLIVPGGGYVRVVIDKEGDEVGRALADAGVTAFVLEYRQPGDGWAAGPDTPLQDGLRAMRTIRARAASFGIDAARVGVLGFSAGGHLAGMLALRSGEAIGPIDDATDRLSARPAFTGLIYPVVSMSAPFAHPGSRKALVGADASPEREAAYSLHRADATGAPPTFLVHAFDDASVPVDNSLLLAASLRAAKAPCEAHFFERGGHGFGLRLAKGRPCEAWLALFTAWVRSHAG